LRFNAPNKSETTDGPAHRTIGHRQRLREYLNRSRDHPKIQMVGVTVPVFVVAGGQAPPDTSSSDFSLSVSFSGVDDIWL